MKVSIANQRISWLRRFLTRFNALDKELVGIMSNVEWTAFLEDKGESNREKKLWKVQSIINDTSSFLTEEIRQLENASLEGIDE